MPAYGPRLTGFVLDAIAGLVAMVTEDAPMLAGVEDGMANTLIVERIMASADAGSRPLDIDWSVVPAKPDRASAP